MNKFIFLFIQSFIIVSSNKNLNIYRCASNKLKIEPLQLNFTENEGKRRLAKEYSTIKFKIDYSSFSKPSSMSDDTYNKIKNSIEDAVSEFQKFLKVQHTDIDLIGKEESIKKACNINSIGIDYGTYLNDNDIILFPTFNDNLDSKEAAASRLCLTHGSTPRPTAGALQINPNINYNMANTDTFLKKIFFHEITHILVFDVKLLRQLGMLTSKNSRTYVTSPKVLSKIKRHFNCSSLSGMPLESQELNGVSYNNHWDARYMLGDYMIPAFYPDLVISEITLALFEDTKYYKVDYYTGGLFKFGKNKGCDFINKNCIINNEPLSEEFCNSFETPICSTSRITKAHCIINDYINYNITIPIQNRYFENQNHGGHYFADFCPVPDTSNSDSDYYPNNCRFGQSNLPSEYGEVMSDTSFCFISSLTPPSFEYNVSMRSMCYKVECHRDTKQIVVHVGETTFICPTNGGITSGNGYKGILTCPKYYDICDTETNQLCNDMFDCLSKKIESSDDSFDMNKNITFDRYIPQISAPNIKMNFTFLTLLSLLFIYFLN